ncbi:cytochrome P450 [Streptomyces phaeofaciens JCM 4814]|uniref:Cytochrome P450 n=1 Tax=Streptomyces phaeofaciens TaxID=68254 RepID=A0A918HP21_9ACTN|nr:cytochrome P450 [Streptomyces phaeofaciens]GGT87552.1 cytochrome P450 [Streptomyces phaeofaciens]
MSTRTPHQRAATHDWRFATAPGGLPLIGHALLMGRRPLEFLASLPAHGDLVELRLGPNRAYLPCHPDLVQEVLLNARVYDTGGPVKEKARPILGNGLITSDWSDHRRQRRLVQPAFHPARLPTYAEVMRDECEAEARTWRAGEVIDVSNAMQALTARVTARALFSTEIAGRAVAEIQYCLPVIVQGAYRQAMDPTGLFAKLPLPANRRFAEALTRMHRLIDGIVEDYRGADGDRGDLLSALLTAEDTETGGRLTDQEIHDQVMTLLLAGIETTASALAWSFHLLGENPRAEAALHAELDEVLDGRPAAYADIPRLDHTQRVFTESLRLYPPAWLYTRTTTEPTELAGRRLPVGADILISPYVLHHNAELFADPESFDPDRWLPERAKDVARGHYLPFGAGSRKCIGDVFGMTEATLALASLGSRWRLRPVPGTRVNPRPHMSLSTGPLPMVPQAR